MWRRTAWWGWGAEEEEEEEEEWGKRDVGVLGAGRLFSSCSGGGWEGGDVEVDAVIVVSDGEEGGRVGVDGSMLENVVLPHGASLVADP